MTEEKQEEVKPIVQLQTLRETYPEINEVQISKDIINKLLTNIYTSSNFGQKMEGVIFGRYTDKQLIVSTLIPCSITESSNANFANYLETSRLDNTKIGFYLCDNGEELLSHQKLKTFIEFQKIFPNCVILTIDIIAVKANTYPFKCFRISAWRMWSMMEDAMLIYRLDRSIERRVFKIYVGGIDESDVKAYVDDMENDCDNNYYYTKDVNFNLNKKIKELNKGCEKLIEEQKKFINYYKNKKVNTNENNLGKDETKKKLKNTGSNQGKGGVNEEKFDLIDFGLYSQNIKEMNNAIRNIIDKKEIDSFTAYNLAN